MSRPFAFLTALLLLAGHACAIDDTKPKDSKLLKFSLSKLRDKQELQKDSAAAYVQLEKLARQIGEDFGGEKKVKAEFAEQKVRAAEYKAKQEKFKQEVALAKQEGRPTSNVAWAEIKKAKAEHDAWFDHPGRIWNLLENHPEAIRLNEKIRVNLEEERRLSALDK